MTAGSSHDFAEVLVDRLFLESFANEHSAYYEEGQNGRDLARALDRFRNKLRWHIDNTLSRRQQQVIRFYLKGKTEREIAAILGITQQVVNIYKHRAIKKLQQVVKP
jgi:RNA polymerase sigma factor (sigma-70 family)